MGNGYNEIVSKVKNDLSIKALESISQNGEVTPNRPLAIFDNKIEQAAAL